MIEDILYNDNREQAAKLSEKYSDCVLCPRVCHADRTRSSGFCACSDKLMLAKAMLHQWEEPCIAGQKGSGAIFFSGCNLKCIFCQNHEISHGGYGREVSLKRLEEIISELIEQGAETIEFVTASHYIPSVAATLERIKYRLKVPVVFNCGGYESVEALHMLDGLIDIYMPDVKYYDDDIAVRYSAASGYFRAAMNAVQEMLRQVGRPVFAESSENAGKNDTITAHDNGNVIDTESDSSILRKGLLIRHLVLPGCRQDSIRLMEELAADIGADNFLISLMSQYTPFYKAKDIKELNRRVTSFEYDSVVERALRLGLKGYMQERTSAKEEYTPEFDLSGI